MKPTHTYADLEGDITIATNVETMTTLVQVNAVFRFPFAVGPDELQQLRDHRWNDQIIAKLHDMLVNATYGWLTPSELL